MRRAPGFTLIEVMVALFIMSVAVVAASRFNQDNQISLAMLRNQDAAVLLARSQAYELLQEGVNAATDKDGEFDTDFGRFRWEAKASSTSMDNYYRLQVRVLWDDPRPGSVQVERLFRD